MLKDTHVSFEAALSWKCRASEKPKPLYRWLKNGQWQREHLFEYSVYIVYMCHIFILQTSNTYGFWTFLAGMVTQKVVDMFFLKKNFANRFNGKRSDTNKILRKIITKLQQQHISTAKRRVGGGFGADLVPP